MTKKEREQLARLAAELEKAELLDLAAPEGHEQFEAAHDAYYTALGSALGYDRPDGNPNFVNEDGLAQSVAMLEARLASK